MKLITVSEAAVLNYATSVRKVKSQLRKDVESLEVGQTARFEANGQDYSKYSQISSAVHLTSKLDGTLTLQRLADGSGAVVTRTA